MNKEQLQTVLDKATFTTGIPLTAEANFETRESPIEVRFAAMRKLESFAVNLHRSPRAWIADLSFDTFSAAIVANMHKTLVANCDRMVSEIAEANSEGFQLDTNILEFVTGHGVREQSNLEFSLRIIASPTESKPWNQISNELESVQEILERAIVLLYLPLSEFATIPKFETQDEVEGERVQRTCTNYSRNARNRKRCLDHFGAICVACGLEPGKIYGPGGETVIHVHHLTPVSLMDGPATVSPYNDLVPLCPNCHNFAHKQSPPYSVEEIKDLISSQSLS